MFGENCLKMAKIANFTKSTIFVEYSTAVEYSDGSKKIFFELRIHVSLPKKNFMSNGPLVLKISIGSPPQISGFSGGGAA